MSQRGKREQNHDVSFASEEETRRVDEEAAQLMREEEGKRPTQSVVPFDRRELADAVERSRRERIQQEEDERQERWRREQGPQGKCPHCKGDLYLLKIMEPFTMHTLIGSRAKQLARFYACQGECKTLFHDLPKQPEVEGAAGE